MAKKRFFVDIDLSRNQLLKAVIENGSDAGMATLLTVAGQVAYNTDNNQLNYFDGTTVQHLIAGTEDFASNITSDVYAASVKAVYDYYKSSGATGGAKVIGIEDTEGFYTATDVEGALNEIATILTDIGSAIHLQSTITADNSNHAYPTSGSGDGGTIQEGDAYLVTGAVNATGETAGSYITVGTTPLWVGAGSLIVAAVSGATNSDADWYILDARRENASETVRGIIAIATQSEVNAGADDTKAVTALKLKAYIEQASGTTMYVEYAASLSGLTATAAHGLGDDVVVQVWLNDSPVEEITSGVALTKITGTATVTVNADPGNTIDIVCVGKATYVL